jgi:lipopolysaccharide transport system permease protein
MTTPSTIYDSTGRDRISLSAWRSMFRELRDYGELVQQLVFRGFSAQFRQSFLGYLWVILPPVATAIVFTLLRKAQVVNVPMAENAMPYALFALIGTTVWGFFTQVSMMATNSIANAGNLVSKIYFPREVLVLSAVGNGVVNLLIRLVVLALSFALLQYAPHWQVVFAPLLCLPILALGIGLGLFFAPINTMMNDVGRMLEFLFQFGMFLAPTVFPTPILSAGVDGWQQALYWVHTLNPVSHDLYAIHSLIETGTFHLTAGLQVSTVVSFLVLFLGWRFFHICEPFLAERL